VATPLAQVQQVRRDAHSEREPTSYRPAGDLRATLCAVSDPALTGGCLCGGVRFELTAPPLTAGYCHCTHCQRQTGTASSAQARIDGRTFRLLGGEHLVQAWRHPDGGFEKCFCRECGAHLYSRNPDDHTQMSVRMGAFDGDPGVRPSWRAHVTYACAWEPIPDDGSSASPRPSRSSEVLDVYGREGASGRPSRSGGGLCLGEELAHVCGERGRLVLRDQCVGVRDLHEVALRQ
jgi:hypothetical protein